MSGTLAGAAFSGYEMHVGRTTGPATVRPFVQLQDGRSDGAVSTDGRVAGTYVHGLFLVDACRAAWLAQGGASSRPGHDAGVEDALDALAAHLERHVAIDRLLSLAR